MWQWQQGGAPEHGSAPSATNQGVPQQPGPGGHQGTGELQDMLQMLDPHTGAAPFEDLNMFNTNFE